MQCTEQLLMLCFACAQAVERRAMLISSITAATVDWIQQRRVRPHLNPCSYQLQLLGFQRVLEFGLTLQRISNLIPVVKKKKKKSLPSRECFFCLLLFLHFKKRWVLFPISQEAKLFFCLFFVFSAFPHDVFFFSDFTSQLSRWGPMAEWSWTVPAVSRHNRLSPLSLAVHMKSNHQKQTNQTNKNTHNTTNKNQAANYRSQEDRESGISHPLKYGGHGKRE